MRWSTSCPRRRGGQCFCCGARAAKARRAAVRGAVGGADWCRRAAEVLHCNELGLSSAAAGASVDFLIERYHAPPIPHVSHAFTCSQTEVGASVARSLDLLPRNPRRHTHALARFQWLPHARQFVCTRAITCRVSLPARARMHLLSRGLSHRSPSKVHEQVRSRAWEQ